MNYKDIVLKTARQFAKNEINKDTLQSEVHKISLGFPGKDPKEILAEISKIALEIKKQELGSHTIDVSSSRPVKNIQREITEQLKSMEEVFSMADRYCVITDHGIKVFFKQDELHGLLTERFICYVTRKGEIIFKEYPYVKALFNSIKSKARLNQIEFYSSYPVLDCQYNPLGRGYHKKEKIYVKENFNVANDLYFIPKVLDTFSFRSNADRSNAVGMMLTSLFHHLFPGKVPGFVVEANQPGAGKGELAQVLSVIKTGKSSATITFTYDESELEKRMGASVKRGDRLLILDNVKPSMSGKEIGGAVLERTLTDRIASFRILGQSETIQVPNNILVVLTYNGGTLSRDLASRSIRSYLEVVGAPENRHFDIPDIVSYCEENLESIIGELMLMVKVWKDKGSLKSCIKHRYKEWASLCGGILQANGFKGFLENVNEVNEENDALLQDLIELGHHMTPNKFYKAKDLVHIVRGRNLFAERFIGVKENSRTRVLGNVLTALVDREFSIGDAVLALRKKTIDNTGHYLLEAISGELLTQTYERIGHFPDELINWSEVI